MKLVFLNPGGFIGGAEMCLLDLLAALRTSRPDWSLRIVLGDDGPLRAAVVDLGASCDVLPMPARLASLGDAGLGLKRGRGAASRALATRGPRAAVAASCYLRRLRRVLRAETPHRVQTNGMKAHALGTLAAPRGVPVIWHLHDFLGARPLMGRLLRWSARLRRAVRVVGVSRAVARDARRVLGPSVPVEAIYNAADLDRFAPGPGDGDWLDRQAGLSPAPSGTVRIGLVATYARWKGHDVFLDAAARLVSKAAPRPVRFYIVGGPLYRSAGSQYSRDELKARAEALGLSGRIGFVPHQEAPEVVYRTLDIVTHASTRPEPFGRVIIEAMACGRAVVAARDGGAAELFEDGISALGTPPGDPDALASALGRLVDDSAWRAALGVAGRRAALARFDRARLAGEWARVLGAEDRDAGRESGTGTQTEAEIFA